MNYRLLFRIAILFAPLALGCSQRRSPTPMSPAAARDTNEIVVRIAQSSSLAQARGALLAVTSPTGGAWGAVLLGAPEGEAGVTRARLSWADQESVELSLVPKDRVDVYLPKDPRAHDSALIAWTATGLQVSHPADLNDNEPIDFSALARQNQAHYGTGRHGVLLLVDQGSEPASRVFASLRDAPRAVSYVIWLLE